MEEIEKSIESFAGVVDMHVVKRLQSGE